MMHSNIGSDFSHSERSNGHRKPRTSSTMTTTNDDDDDFFYPAHKHKHSHARTQSNSYKPIVSRRWPHRMTNKSFGNIYILCTFWCRRRHHCRRTTCVQLYTVEQRCERENEDFPCEKCSIGVAFVSPLCAHLQLFCVKMPSN